MERALRRVLLGLWALWFFIVTATNACDLLKSVGVLGGSFGFVSNNLEMISRATGMGVAFNRVLFAGVIVWEATAAVGFAWAAVRRPRSLMPFAAALSLFLTFMIGDELCRTYGPQGMHIRLFVALAATLFLTRLRPDPAQR